MFVSEALLPNPLIVSEDTSILSFIRGFLSCDQTTAVVLDENRRLLGMVSAQDVLKLILPSYVSGNDRLARVIREGYFEEKFQEFANTPVRRVMTRKVDTLEPTDTVMEAVAFFVNREHKTIPVVHDGVFVGTITRRSLLRRVTEGAT